MTTTRVTGHMRAAAAALLGLWQSIAAAHSADKVCVPARYKVIELPLQPLAINHSLQVAGTSERHRAAVWKRGAGLEELPLPDGYDYAEAVAINSAGDVVGNAHSRDSLKQMAFLYRRGTLTALAGVQARAYGINDAGVIAGAAVAPEGGKTVPVTWERDGAHTPTQCCGGSETAINRLGHTIGDVYDDHGRYHAFLLTGTGDPRPIGPADHFSTAVAINGHDHILIQTFPVIYLYADGSLRRLDLHPRLPSKPIAINDCDVVVGAFGPFSDADRAFVWDDKSGFQDLNGKIPPQSGWKLESATAITDDGVIVGRGDKGGEDDAGFMLLPER